jgi:hypothetical protein
VPEAVQLLGLLQAATKQQQLQQLVCYMLRQKLQAVHRNPTAAHGPCHSGKKARHVTHDSTERQHSYASSTALPMRCNIS